MSVELAAKGPLALTRFFGGRDRGTCLQISDNDNDLSFVQIELSDLPALIADLQAVADGSIGEQP